MVMEALRKGAAGGLGKFILMGFMALAVGGLVLMDMGGFFRGGVSNSDIVKIGRQSISTFAFDRTVRRHLGQVGIGPEQAYQMGYIDRILRSEISSAVLGKAARDSGISISDKLAATQINDMVAPMAGPDGDVKATLDRILMNQGLSEGAFVAGLKSDMANNFLAGSLSGGFSFVSESVAKDLFRAKNEKRDISYVNFPHDDVRDVIAPTEEQLGTLYEAGKERFSSPETRNLKIIVLNTEELKKRLDVSEAVLKQRYESERDFYAVNESWTLDQALLDSDEQAQAVYEAVQKGQSVEASVKQVTGNATAYLGEKQFDQGNLPENLKDVVVEVKERDQVLSPVSSALGTYVVKITGHTPAGVQPFEKVRAEIEKDVVETQLIDQMYDQANLVEDLLASGTPLDEVIAQADVDVFEIQDISVYENPQAKFKGLENLQQELIKTGFEFAEGETSPMQEMSDGRFVAVHVEAIKPKTYTPFEDIKDELVAKWTEDQKRLSNRMRVKQALGDGQNFDVKSFAKANNKSVKTLKGIAGNKADEKNTLPMNAVQSLFVADMNAPLIIDTQDGYAVAVVDDVKWPETIDQNAFDAFKAELARAQQDEIMTVFLNGKRDEYGVKVNQRALERMYGGSDTAP